jgi:hypothetical protein
MEEGVVTKIAELAQKPIEIGGFLARPAGFTLEDPASLIKAGPRAKYIEVARLGALRDYLKSNRDSLDLAHLAVHVVSPSQVSVMGPLDSRARDREYFLVAKTIDTSEEFLNQWMTVENFIIGLQTRFADDGDRQKLLGLLGTVKDERALTSQDDGVTQTVTAKAGIALVAQVTVPNPVQLAPFRTFRDVVQPPSAFVFRVQGGGNGELPKAALFEADAGTWRLTAVERIASWLEEALQGLGVAILA